jgi:hypothetical protein
MTASPVWFSYATSKLRILATLTVLVVSVLTAPQVVPLCQHATPFSVPFI